MSKKYGSKFSNLSNIKEQKIMKSENEVSKEEVISTPEVIEQSITEEVNLEITKEIKTEESSKKENSKIKLSSSKSTTKKEFIPVYDTQIQLISYMEAMLPTKIIDPIEGGKWQYHLYLVFKQVLAAKEQEEFNSQFNTILHFFKENKDSLFNFNYMFRFPEYFTGSDKEFTVFRNIAYLAIETCEPETRRKNLENINLETLTADLSETEKQKLINFYLI